MFCKKCGAQLSESAKFCGSCGTKVASAEGKVAVNQTKRSGKGKGAGKVLAMVLAAAVVVGAGAVALPAVLGRTVYLATEIVTKTPAYKDVLRFEYNEDGKILSYEGKAGADGFSWEYEYEDGRIVAAEYDGEDGVELTLEYEYDSKGNLVAVESEDFEAEVECDKEGRIVQIEVEGDYDSKKMSYSYYSSGQLKEVEYDMGVLREIFSYNEDGKLVELVYYHDGEKYQSVENEYDKNGNQLSETTILYSGGKKDIVTEETYTYDKKGHLTGYTVERKAAGEKATVECEVIRDGAVEAFIITDLSGDSRTIRNIASDLEEDDVYMEREYDKYGNLIRDENFATEYKTEYEYMAFKAPRGYIEAFIEDPEYFYVVTW